VSCWQHAEAVDLHRVLVVDDGDARAAEDARGEDFERRARHDASRFADGDDAKDAGVEHFAAPDHCATAEPQAQRTLYRGSWVGRLHGLGENLESLVLEPAEAGRRSRQAKRRPAVAASSRSARLRHELARACQVDAVVDPPSPLQPGADDGAVRRAQRIANVVGRHAAAGQDGTVRDLLPARLSADRTRWGCRSPCP
jgi:hypothetical protein